MRYLGIDWGEKRIGMSIGEEKLAVPFGVADNLDGILEIIKEEEIDEVVVGVPFKMRDNTEAVDERFTKFLEKLKEKTSLKINEIDERLSSKQADALDGTKKEKHPRDAVAAMLILQSFIDSQNA